MLKNSKVVLFLSPQKVGQAGNFWTTYIQRQSNLTVTEFSIFLWPVNGFMDKGSSEYERLFCLFLHGKKKVGTLT